jgi:hypothetical protein
MQVSKYALTLKNCVLNYRQKSAAKPDLSISLEFKQRSKGGKGFPTGSPSFFLS